MIGAASGAMGGPNTRSATAPAQAKSGHGAKAAAADPGMPAARADTTPTPDAASANPAACSEPAPINAAVQRDAAQDGHGRDVATPGDFAALLAATRPVETVASAAVAAPPAEASTSDPATTSALPGQLLALLSGNWAMPAPPTPASTEPSIEPAAVRNTTPLPTLRAISDTIVTLGEIAAGTLDPSSQPGSESGVRADSPQVVAAPPIANRAALAVTADTSASQGERAFAAFTSPGTAGSDPATHSTDASPSYDATAALTAALPTLASARATVSMPTAPLALPADPETGFDDGLGARIAWMAEQRVGHAEIRLNPEHIGPIDVRVQLDGTRVLAEFHSAHAEVRQALEASLPRLRELLGQHGLQLGQADVGQRQDGQGQAARGDKGNRGGAGTDGDARASVLAPRLRSRGLLDEYA